jgi:hypothetical protein
MGVVGVAVIATGWTAPIAAQGRRSDDAVEAVTGVTEAAQDALPGRADDVSRLVR